MRTDTASLEINRWVDYRDRIHADITVTVDADDWLYERATVNEEYDALLDILRDREEAKGYDGMDEYEICSFFPQYLIDIGQVESIAGIYGDGDPVTVNTYNHENVLDNTLLFTYWEDDNGGHVVVQKHLGGDVRGNYSMGTVYDTDVDCGIFDYARAYVCCSGGTISPGVPDGQLDMDGNEAATVACNARWWTDDAYHFYRDDDDYRDLAEYDPIESDDGYTCPHCGNGRLEAST
jgi:hypothetical protein